MTTHAARNGTLGPTLKSLADQSIKPDRLYIYAAPGTDTDSILSCIERDDRTKVSVVEAAIDLGPIMKLSAVLEDVPADSLIITVDDDIIYQRDWLMTLLIACAAHPDKAIGFSGWSARYLVEDDCYSWAVPLAYADVLEGWAGAAYRARFFTPGVFKAPKQFRNVDDVWISSYLNRRGIFRYVAATPLCTPTNATKGLHDRPDFKQLNREAARIGFNL